MVRIVTGSYNLDYMVMPEKLKIIEVVITWFKKESQTLTSMRIRQINISFSEDLR